MEIEDKLVGYLQLIAQKCHSISKQNNKELWEFCNEIGQLASEVLIWRKNNKEPK